MLKELSEKEDNIIFIDNDEGFMAEGQAYGEVFQKRGVHINMRGKVMLADSFKSAIREAHNKSNLWQECDIVGSPKN